MKPFAWKNRPYGGKHQKKKKYVLICSGTQNQHFPRVPWSPHTKINQTRRSWWNFRPAVTLSIKPQRFDRPISMAWKTKSNKAVKVDTKPIMTKLAGWENAQCHRGFLRNKLGKDPVFDQSNERNYGMGLDFETRPWTKKNLSLWP